MNTSLLRSRLALYCCAALLFGACREQKESPSQAAIVELSLNAARRITCGPTEQKLGSVDFPLSGSTAVNQTFRQGLLLLHSFEYDEAEKVFATLIHDHPDCAMAYWGVAMSSFHPLWAPPSAAELTKGAKALELARSIPGKSQKEADYIEALTAFYRDWASVEHRTRCLRFEKATETLSRKYPTDKEAASFYALALTAAADPTDTAFAKQKKAGALLMALYPGNPNHPGVVHYLIHAYDAPELAALALPAARHYAAVAPSSAHALHMPSHIFTRLGLWGECIQSNLASVDAARCYGEAAGIPGHWDEELHGLDYLVYAYLQRGDNGQAHRQWDYLNTIREVQPANFKVAYAFAAIPSRYLLENRQWAAAAALTLPPTNVQWQKFPWQQALVHFTRLLGAVHLNQLAAARVERQALHQLQQRLAEQKELYQAAQVQRQLTVAEAWIRWKEDQPAEALRLMTVAADEEDHTAKHPVTPGEVLPAREMLGDLLMEMKRPAEALVAYEANLQKHPNRFNGLYGAGRAAAQSGNPEKARRYYQQLLTVTQPTDSPRPELAALKGYLAAR
jgi:tetratricopeptide (TPR) repeat protein